MDAKFPVLLFPLRVETRFNSLGNKQYELWIRVFPDDIALNRHVQQLSKAEKKAGDLFWQVAGGASATLDSMKGPWRTLASGHGVPRAAWIAHATKPGSLPSMDDSTFKKTYAELMPDTLHYFLFDKNHQPLPVLKSTPGTAAWEMSMDWTKSNIQGAKNLLPSWIVDFDTACMQGRGIKYSFTLGSKEDIAGFSKLIVVGIRSGTTDASRTTLENLLKSHHFANGGMEFTPPGTPTNNTSDGASGYNSIPDVDTALPVELGNPLFQSTNDVSQKTDGQELAEALGIDAAVFQQIKNSNLKTRRNAEDMNRCLWPATLGYFLEESLTEPSKAKPSGFQGSDLSIVSANHLFQKPDATGELRLDLEALDKTRDFFVRHVKSRGTLPGIRIGKQPYGILPVSPDLFIFNSDNIFSNYFDNDIGEEYFSLIAQMRDRWESATKIKNYGTETAPDLINIDYLQSIDFLESIHIDYTNKGSFVINNYGNTYRYDKMGDYTYSKITDPYKKAQRFLQILGLQPRSPRIYHRYGIQDGSTGQSPFFIDPFSNYSTKRNFGTAFDDLLSNAFIYPRGPKITGNDLVLGQIRFLDQLEPLIGALVDSKSNDPSRFLPKEIVETIFVPQGPKIVQKNIHYNYLEWLLKTNLDKICEQAATDPDQFDNARSIFYLLIRNAWLNENWDIAMRLYEKEGLRDFRVKNFPLQLLEKDIKDRYPKFNVSSFKLQKPDLDIFWNDSGLTFTPENDPNITLKQVVINYHFSGLDSIIKKERLDTKLNRLNYRHFILGYISDDLIHWGSEKNIIENVFRPVNLDKFHFAQSRHPFLFLEIQRGDLSGLNNFPDHARIPMWKYLQDPSKLKANYPVESAGYYDFRNRLERLSQLPVEELERLLTEHLDLCSHRLDAWLLAIVSHRLSKQRQSNPTGIHIGAYGFLENLRYDPPQTNNFGYIHAPSLDQAATAAILRAGDKASGDNLAFRVNLSSNRARRAMEMVEGIRNGLTAEEIFKKSSNNPAEYEANDVDALADLWTAEAILQLNKGNLTRAGAALEMMTTGTFPPEPEVVPTPRSGTTLTHRAGLCWAKNNTAPPNWNTTLTPRAIAEPSLNYWLGDLLGNPTNVKCKFVPKKSGVQPVEVSISELKLQPIDLLYLVTPGCESPDSDLSKYVRSVALTKMSLSDASEGGTPDYKLPAADMTFAKMIFLLRKIAGLLSKGRPLTTDDWIHPGFQGIHTCRIDLNEMLDRLNKLIANMKTLDSSLSGNIVALDFEIKLASMGTIQIGGGWGGSSTIKPKIIDLKKLEAVKNLLTQLAYYNIREGFAEINISADLASAKNLLNHSKKALAVFRSKTSALETAKVQATPTEQPKTDDLGRFAEKCQIGVKAVFGEAFYMAPLILTNQKSQNPSTEENQNQLGLIPMGAPASARKNLSQWLAGIASVRPKMALLEEFILSSDMLLPEILNAKKPWIAPVQLPARTVSDNWVGWSLPDNYWTQHAVGERLDKLSLVFNFPANLTGIFSGLLLDEWTEVIPEKEQTTGLAFHYNQPNARAPQALLLAVAPPADIRGFDNWDENYLMNCVMNSIRLAKIRAFDPEHLMPTLKRYQDANHFDAWSHLLPGILSRVNDYNERDEIAADFATNNIPPEDNSGIFPPRPKTTGNGGSIGTGTSTTTQTGGGK